MNANQRKRLPALAT